MENPKEGFKEYLLQQGFSDNTLLSYLSAVYQFLQLYGQVTAENLISYRTFLLERFRPSTVNTRICAINRYLDYLEKTKPRGNCQQETARLKVVKCQPKTFVDTVISRKDYNKLKKKLEAEENWFWYFLVRVMACTGVRVSELVQIKAEHIRDSYMDICSKGSKTRRIYFPRNLQQEMLAWLGQENHQSGLIFINKSGRSLTSREINRKLKVFARRYHIPGEVMTPHSFRHRFAQNFLAQYNDITLLADLLGHSSLKTTRIYLTKSSDEQWKAVDRIVTW